MLWLLRAFFVPNAEPLAQPAFPPVENTFQGEGIVSLLPLGTDAIIAGTKRGNLERFRWNEESQSLAHDGPIKPLPTPQDGSPKSIPYPIYSLLSIKQDDTFQLFCGGGDRYITKWEHDTEAESWKVAQKLGPHTGWVKALSMDANKGLVHSIGCNCIETWMQSGKNEEWEHLRKRTIESSPDLGATLSSDLLCLAQFQDLLCSGGVDGRVHIWPSDPGDSLQPLRSIAAHDGRVNTLVTVPLDGNPDSCLLFSAGHDGVLQCRKLERSEDGPHNIMVSGQPIGSLQILDESDEAVRIAAMTCHSLPGNNNKSVCALVGTTSGVLHKVLVSANDDGAWTSCEMKHHSNVNLDIDETTIHSMLAVGELEESSCSCTIVGHAKGLSTVRFNPP